MKLVYILYFLLSAIFLPVENSYASHDAPLKVGVAHSPPFAIHDTETNTWEGLGIELFKYITEELKLSYTFVEIKDFSNLQALRTEYDVLIGDLPYSTRILEHYQLSIPYYASGYGILTQNTKSESILIYQIFHNLFSLSFLFFILIVFIFIVFISISMWLIERNHNKSFPKKIGPGVFNGIWWTIITCGGVGAEIYPVTRRGRIFGMICVCFSIVVLSHVTGIISSSLTAERLDNQVSDLKDLKHKHIAAVLDKENDIGDFLHRHHLNYLSFNSLEEATLALKKKKVDVIIASAPVLKYYLKQNNSENFSLSPLGLGTNYYGFLFNINTKNMIPINSAILKITDGKIWKDLLFKYLDESSR